MKTLELLPDLFGSDPTPGHCSIRPKKERREQAGGFSPYVTEYDARGEKAGVSGIAQFDWNEVLSSLDGEDGMVSVEEAKAIAKEMTMQMASIAIAEVIEWIFEEVVNTMTVGSETREIKWGDASLIRCKANIVRLHLRPANMGNPTLDQLAARLGVSKQRLDQLWLDYADRFGVTTTWSKQQKEEV